MIIHNVFVRKDVHVSVSCADSLLSTYLGSVGPVWGEKGLESYMKDLVDSIQFQLMYHADIKQAFKDGAWTVGWYRSEKVYSRYHKENGTFEIFRIGDID